jgi:RNA polymerase sigma-70 factor (ECF subfamily)
MDEIKIIKQCLNGEMEAFEMLVKKYQSSLTAFALNMLGDYDEARDIAQETFVQAYFNLNRFDLSRNFKTWLFGIAVKRTIDFTRKKKSFLNYFNKQTKESELKKVPKIERIEQSVIFNPLLKKLKPKERMSIILKVNEDFSARDMSEVLDCSESTARVHLYNARVKLKKWLLQNEKSVSQSCEVLP